jgi:hypothetical protein
MRLLDVILRHCVAPSRAVCGEHLPSGFRADEPRPICQGRGQAQSKISPGLRKLETQLKSCKPELRLLQSVIGGCFHSVR